jgi:hypothetical protein
MGANGSRKEPRPLAPNDTSRRLLCPSESQGAGSEAAKLGGGPDRCRLEAWRAAEDVHKEPPADKERKN